MRRIILVFALMISSIVSYADEFNGHCRDREPYLVASGEECVGPVAEIIETALSRIGHTVVWREVPWKRSIESAKLGSVDILPRHSMDIHREEFLDAVAYEHKVRHLYFMISPLKSIEIDSFADLEGLKVGVLRGSFYSDQFNSQKNFSKIELDTNDQIVKMLELGRIDVGVTSAAHEEVKFRLVEGIKEAKYKETFLNGRYISIPKASPMNKHFDKFAHEISKMLESGEVAAIFDKYEDSTTSQRNK